MHKLVLVRHGESTWNKENRFTGWTDVDLSEKGVQEAIEAGQVLARDGFAFDIVYTSVLKRAIKTGNTASDVWLNKSRQEQMLASYAPVRGENGEVVGALIVGTPLNDERLARTSTLTSGQSLAFSSKDGVIAAGGNSANDSSFANDRAVAAAQGALKSGSLTNAPGAHSGRLFGAVRVEGYGDAPFALVASVPESLENATNRPSPDTAISNGSPSEIGVAVLDAGLRSSNPPAPPAHAAHDAHEAESAAAINRDTDIEPPGERREPSSVPFAAPPPDVPPRAVKMPPGGGMPML